MNEEFYVSENMSINLRNLGEEGKLFDENILDKYIELREDFLYEEVQKFKEYVSYR